MKVIKLIAEDVKGLKAVEITPDGNLVEIAGENEAGKSSVLDAIWLVLAGRQASSEVEAPVRKGQEKGHATIDLGDMIATRTWTKAGSSLKVTSGDGKQVFSSPQSVLDALRAKFLDPGEFIAKDSREQRQAILDLVDLGIDLDAMAAERKRLFDDRTTVGQQGKAIGEVAGPDAGVPEEEVSASQILNEMRTIEERNREIRDIRVQHESAQEEVRRTEASIAELQTHLKTVQIQTAKVAQEVERLGEAKDTSSLEADLASVEDTNRAVRVNAERKTKVAEKDRLRAEYEALTKKIDGLDKKKSDAIAKADLPVEGMDFTEDGITLDGVPFKDGSSSQKMIAALRIAASFNPQLRVIQVRDGSLLDKKNFQIVKDFAEENDYQIWMETVGEGHGSAILIEDGQVI